MNKWIIICVFLIISLSSSLVIILWSNDLNLNTTFEKWSAGILIVMGLGFLFLIPVFSQTLWLAWSKRYSDKKRLNPADSLSNEQHDYGVNHVYDAWKELKQRKNFNYHTRNKPLLGIVGDVHLLFSSLPELTSHKWVETADAFFVNLRQEIPLNTRFNKPPVDAVLSISSYDYLNYAQVDELVNMFAKMQWHIPIYIVGLDGQSRSGSYECCISHAIDLEKMLQINIFPSEWLQPLNVYITQMLEHDIRADFCMRLQRFLNQHQQEVMSYFQYYAQRLNPSLMQRWLMISSDTHHVTRNIVEGIGKIPRGRKKTNSYADKICFGMTSITVLSCVFMFYSFIQTNKDIEAVNKQLGLSKKVNNGNQIQMLLEWQVLIQHFEQEQSGKRFFNFGMARQSELIRFAKKNYGEHVKNVLMPALNEMANKLGELNQVTFQENEKDDIYYDTLKAYLMLTEQPEKTESVFLNKMLNDYAFATESKRLQLILKFYAENLAANPDWRLKEDRELINHSRSTLVHLIGMIQADQQVYRKIIDDAAKKYPDRTLADLIKKDYRGIWISNEMLPSVYTDEAWNNYVKPAFLEASKRKGGMGDWVLAMKDSETSGNITEDKLREYYFKDYQQAWYQFLNGITWSEQSSIQDTASQLRLYSDPQNSPLLALFAVIRENAHPDEQEVGLADNLAQAVRKQVNTIANRSTPKIAKPIVQEGVKQGNQVADDELDQFKENFASPVKEAFSPLVQLVDPNENPNNELSLQRYLERVSGTEQKLKQIYQAPVPDDAAKQVVQSVLTGNSNEFTEGNRYAKLIEASLGAGLTPFAQQIFVQPFRVSWTGISMPAQRSINELWRKSVLESWQKDFSGRYPFSNTESEIAIPLLAKYLEPQQGLIDQFIQQQLSGVVTKQGDQWVASSDQIMQLNPEFLDKINQLKTISQDLFFHGDTGYFFELKPVPTANLVYYSLSIDGQNLEYFNQKSQWQSFKWPGDLLKAGTRITWESQSGGWQKEQEFNGRWGLIRLLEQAKVTQSDKSTYLLEWRLKNSHLVRVYLRTTSGKGPLALLDLKATKLPEMVLMNKSTGMTTETEAHKQKSTESKEKP
ncbi:hypothetical protein MIS46_10000 [Wielerella bovis]|uniref:ImcF-related family protein n=1 Tax=Wielerella bovis TaxID=2917790 RepID=UPI00201939D4|nr:ImcF-related family protein [Wielerella bovis]ULJ62277.1 hypothetical protein MIS46_10000 [Wielerella bovis]